MAKKNIVYRKNPSTGEIEYPVTSSAAVGMSDGSGNLDNKLSKLEGKSACLFDVSERFPTGGTDGTDNYTIETAIAAVSPELRLYVRYLSFKISDTERELWQFNAIRTHSISQFTYVDNWYKMRPSMFHEVEWKTNSNVTRNYVPKYNRVSGMIIHYTDNNENSIYELYVGKDNAIDADYYNNFIQLYVSSQIDEKIKYNVSSAFVQGDFANAIKELYIDKYEEGAIYQIKRLVLSDYYHNGLIWINKQGDSTDYSVVNNNNLGGTNGGIVEAKSADGLFHAYLIIDWSKITYGYNEEITMVISDAAKVIENSPSIYAKLSISLVSQNAEIGAGLENRLYNKTENIVFEDLEEQAGDENYTYNNIGLVHKATEQESFNVIKVRLLKLSNEPITNGSLIVKKGTSVSMDGGTIIKQVDNFSNSELPESGLYEVQLGKDVTLEVGEYLWVYYTGNRVTIGVWKSNNDGGTRVGMYFQGDINTYRYSTAMTLIQSKGDLVKLDERVSAIEEELGTGGDDNKKVTTPMITLPTDLYVVTGREQTFYYNEFIYGIESNRDNTLLNYNIEARVSPSGMGNKCLTTKEGFTIYTKTTGDYTITVAIYDQFNNLLVEKVTTLHVINATAVSGKSILMLGDSWTDINNGDKGYTSYVNKALKEMGITMKFIGTRDAGTSGLKHEGIGGYAYTTFVNAPSVVRFKFFVDDMPSISSDDIYSNNGSTYKLFERGSNYLTMSRQSGSTEPSGNTLTRTSGTGDETITFTSWTVGGSNPLWNNGTNELDFTHYRQDLCGLSTPLDICNIQLGVNDSFGNLKTTKTDWAETLSAVTTLVDAILADSPNCKIIINLAGMDCPSPTGWASLNGFTAAKRNYQINNYYLRTYINELIEARDDYKTNVFIGQSVMGINRWYGYGYVDRRYRYFKISESMPEYDLTKLKNFDFQQRSVYTYTDDTNEEFQAHFYDARGYLVCVCSQGFASWDKHEQEFVNAQSVPQDTVPTAGNLTKGDGSASVDFPVVPYTDCFIENNSSKEHWFMNATHPYDLGYRQMAYCVAHQIAALLVS